MYTTNKKLNKLCDIFIIVNLVNFTKLTFFLRQIVNLYIYKEYFNTFTSIDVISSCLDVGSYKVFNTVNIHYNTAVLLMIISKLYINEDTCLIIYHFYIKLYEMLYIYVVYRYFKMINYIVYYSIEQKNNNDTISPLFSTCDEISDTRNKKVSKMPSLTRLKKMQSDVKKYLFLKKDIKNFLIKTWVFYMLSYLFTGFNVDVMSLLSLYYINKVLDLNVSLNELCIKK